MESGLAPATPASKKHSAPFTPNFDWSSCKVWLPSFDSSALSLAEQNIRFLRAEECIACASFMHFASSPSSSFFARFEFILFMNKRFNII